MSDAEFWHLSLRQVDALMRRHADRERRLDFRAGVIATVCAAPYAKKGHSVGPERFFPSLKQKRPQTFREMRAKWRSLVAGINAVAEAKKREGK